MRGVERQNMRVRLISEKLKICRGMIWIIIKIHNPNVHQHQFTRCFKTDPIVDPAQDKAVSLEGTQETFWNLDSLRCNLGHFQIRIYVRMNRNLRYIGQHPLIQYVVLPGLTSYFGLLTQQSCNNRVKVLRKTEISYLGLRCCVLSDRNAVDY